MQGYDATALDRWLTAEPDNGFDTFCEQIENELSDEFMLPHESWLDTDEYSTLVDALFMRYDDEVARGIEQAYKTKKTTIIKKKYSPTYCAKIVERFHSLYATTG